MQKKAATFLFMAGQFEDVRTRVEAVLKKNPRDIEAQLLYANALVGLRDLEGGVREIEEAVQLDPQHAATYTNLALLKLAQGQRQAAQEAFKQGGRARSEVDPGAAGARPLRHGHRQPGAGRRIAEGGIDSGRERLRWPIARSPPSTSGPGGTRWRKAVAGRRRKSSRAPRAKFALAEYYARLNRPLEARRR